VPLAAVAAGISHSSSRKIDLFRLGAAAGLYVGFLALHKYALSVSPFPPL
jgi:hypothetical protein